MELETKNLDKGVLRRIQSWKDSCLQFVNDCVDVTPTEQQLELLVAASKDKRISIRSGHGCGKDSSTAWVAAWFLSTRPYAKVVVTAPTAHQLSDIFWTEMSKWLRKSKVVDEFVVQKDKIFHKSSPKEWWCRAISVSAKATKEEQAETLSGLHGDHLLIIIDEASGVPDPVFIPLEGALTQEDNKVILIGNMTKNRGYFYDTHFHSEIAKDWSKFHWDSRNSSIVNKEMPEYFARKYGIDSNVFKIRVEGNPPLEDATVFIPFYAAEQCIGREIEVAEDEPLYLGVDVARYGDDASVILPRRGLKIYPWQTYHKLNTMDLGGFINQTYQEEEADGCAIDCIGVGGGVADWLEKRNMKGLYQVNVTAASSNIEKYHKLRDELWTRVRENCFLGKYSFPDVLPVGEVVSLGRQLADELSSVKYSFNAHGGFLIESKKEMRARGIASSNIADALGLTEYFANVSTRVFTKGINQRVGKAYPKTVQTNPFAWMTV